MLLLPRQKTPSLQQLEVLLPRLNQYDPLYQRLADRLHRERSGYLGEKSLDYYFNLLKITDFPTLHGLRLHHNNHFFQIDSLFLLPNFYLIVEVKNHTGVITYQSDLGQMVRELESGKLERFKDPLLQASVQRHHLSDFLKINNLPTAPIHTLIVFSNSNVILQLDQPLTTDIILAEGLLKRVPSLQKSYKEEHVSMSELRKLGKFLANAHQPDQTRIIDKLQIRRSQIKDGVWCPECSNEIMNQVKSHWRCPSCNMRNKTVLLNALNEYSLLFGPEITNKEARKFLGVTSENIMKHLFRKTQFKAVGKNRGRKYIIH
ncbi:nuclease-related domain-containing protein [Lentibacillus saliphilus]|uniref:nuclease-related domain-containing protein n=1 Tax=Lentibacillus saliphilus TaxID=2737028 RepID=UPI001C2FAEF2|nr:nuclease-related domain-containing protein [Lentibacillus saliphilus]